MKSLKDISFLIIGAVIIVCSFYLFLQKPAPERYQSKVLTSQVDTLRIGDKSISVEVANTPEARTQGLSGRKELKDNTGMLFVFDTPAQYGFWMKEMNFALDIVWIDEMLHIVGIEKEVSPDTFPQVFKPVESAKYVLEMPAGWVEKNNIDIGQVVYFDSQSTQ